MTEDLLRIRDLHVDIRTHDALLHPVRGISFEVARSETLAIVGESGCGKSLTSLAVMGLLPKAATLRASDISLSGEALLGLPQRRWRSLRGSRIAMIFQDPMTALDPCYTIENQMVEVLRQHRRHVSNKAARDLALERLRQVRIPSPEQRLRQYPHQLSGGLRQRVLIAMALICEPELIIADEPTTALDVTIQAQILGLLNDIQTKTGIGLIIITHDIGVVAGISDRIIVMYGGQIVESGQTADVLSKPLHPYTEGLMRSVPIPGKTPRQQPLGFIAGTVPRQIGDLKECGFAGRCPYAHHACFQSPIELRSASSERKMRCNLPLDGSGLTGDVWTRVDRTRTMQS